MVTSPIDIIILAGGAGSRMGGQDKGLITIEGQSSSALLAKRFCHGQDHLIISANRHLDHYRQLTPTVVADAVPGLGPLAGIQAALSQSRYDTQLIIPCDMPFLPPALKPTLLKGLSDERVHVLHDGKRLQPLCLALSGSHWIETIDQYLANNRRSMMGWLESLPTLERHIPHARTEMFRNLNHTEDLSSLD